MGRAKFGGKWRQKWQGGDDGAAWVALYGVGLRGVGGGMGGGGGAVCGGLCVSHVWDFLIFAVRR